MNTLNKELPKRFTDAVSKLYNAFHKGELDAMDCEFCAVGNICNNNWDWAVFTGYSTSYGLLNIEYATTEEIRLGYKAVSGSGYSPTHIVNIEKSFLDGMGAKGYSYGFTQNKENQFKGLCAVIEYLCELDNIPNILDYTSLFEFNENNEAKNELQLN